MAITEKRDPLSGLIIQVASCDDCGKALAVATRRSVVEDRLRRSRPGWTPGAALFCLDMDACTERTWQRYGRHLQEVIERQQRQRQAAQAQRARRR